MPSVRFDRNWLLIPLLSVFAWAPLLYPSFIQSQSGLADLYRVAQPAAADAFFPSLPGQTAPLAYLLGRALSALGLGPLDAVKLVNILGMLLSGPALYLAARRPLGRAGGLVAAVIYTYLPYHLALVYVRGALAESLAVALLPLTLWATDLVVAGARAAAITPGAAAGPRLHDRRLWTRLAVLALTMAALATAHPGLALAAVPFLTVYTWFRGGARHALAAFLAGLPGIVLAVAILWPPRTLEGRQLQFVDLYRLFSPTWQAGPGQVPLQLGVVAVVMALLALFAARSPVEDAPPAPAGAPAPPVRLWAAAIVLLLCLMTPLAQPVWTLLRLPLILPYPWQLLALVGLPLSLAAGAVVTGPRWGAWMRQPAALAVLVAATVLAGYPYLSPRYIPAADLPDVNAPPLAHFEDGIVLLGYARPPRTQDNPQAQPGMVTVRLFWQAVAFPPADGGGAVAGDYTIFNHLLEAAGRQVGQKDSQPVQGTRPTTSWQPGEYLVDSYEIPASLDGTAGPYTLEIGLYQVSTGQRLPQVAPQKGATEIRVRLDR